MQAAFHQGFGTALPDQLNRPRRCLGSIGYVLDGIGFDIQTGGFRHFADLLSRTHKNRSEQSRLGSFYGASESGLFAWIGHRYGYRLQSLAAPQKTLVRVLTAGCRTIFFESGHVVLP